MRRAGFKGKMVSLLVVFSLLWLSGNLTAGERRGATIVVHKKDGAQVKGELIAVKQDSILLLGSSSGTDVSIDVSDIKTITLLGKSKAGAGFGYGLLIGGAVGACIGIASGTSNTIPKFTAGEKALIGAGLLGLAGGLIGLMVGGSSNGEQTIQIEGKNVPEIQYELKALKSKARIPDYH